MGNNNELKLSKEDSMNLINNLYNPPLDVLKKRNVFLDSLKEINIEKNGNEVLIDVKDLEIKN